jgi:hypothetical protein
MPQQQKAKAKGRKIGRNKKHQATIYKSADRWETNRKRAMRRHLRANPSDTVTAAEFEKRYGKVQSLGLSCRGKKLKKRADKLAQAA